MRRRLALGLILALAARPGEAAQRRRRSRRGRRDGATEDPYEVSPEAPQETGREAVTAAPVPNRDLEGPHVSNEARTRLGPSILYQNLPHPGQAGGGSLNQTEDKLYKPAPGARLNVPFSY